MTRRSFAFAFRRAVALAMAALSPGAPAGAAWAAAPSGDGGLPPLDRVSLCDCTLPPVIRGLGRTATYAARGRVVRTDVLDCKIRGGEWTIVDRADYRTALGIWLPEASAGSAEAQHYVGQIYERGLGTEPDFAQAREWYLKAAEQGLKAAQVSLGYLYERGLGVPVDRGEAVRWYQRAAGLDGVIVMEPLEAAAPRSRASAPPAGTPNPSGTAIRDARAAGPVIEIIEPRPVVTRGLEVRTKRTGTLEVIGRASSPAGIFSVLVGGRAAALDEAGLFRATLDLDSTPGPVVVVAVDRDGRRSEARIALGSGETGGPPAAPAIASPDALAAGDAFAPSRRGRANARGVRFGRYHALVIANAEYAHLPDLETPQRDADVIADLLRTRYGFEVQVLRNATLYDVLSALNQLRRTLTKDDNLLVYYAGHGQLDDESMEGYWLPVDAEMESDANWLPTARISTYLEVIPAKQILIISDSCFSGALTRSSLPHLDRGLTEEEQRHWLEVMARKKARVALTSGGLTPVMDAGGGGHSVFNRALTEALSANDEVLEAQRLYRQVAARVAHVADAAGVEQEPECAPIRHAGHEAGDFLFVPNGGRK
jgi:hypothetical protein